MADELETVLRLVADGTLTPEQAAPIIEALSRPEGRKRVQDARVGAEKRASTRGRQLRIRVTEHGRQVVNLRIPIGFVDAALSFVPGIGGDQSERIRQAVAAGSIGPIIDVEDPDGDGVLISVE
jgi:hypothetical protein